MRGRREPYAVHRLDLGSGDVATVFQESGDLRHLWLSVSPDERWILYSAMPWYEAELMLMERCPPRGRPADGRKATPRGPPH